MLTIGCHLSKRRGYLEMAKEAASINANTFQYFTRSPRGSEQAALDEKDVAAYLAFAKEHGIHDALAYAPYDADPATDKMNERDFALMVYSEDLARLAEVDGSLYLIRPGSRLNISVEEGLADVADALNKIGKKTIVCLREQIPFWELRAISNTVGEPFGQWNIPLATDALARAIGRLLQTAENTYRTARPSDDT